MTAPESSAPPSLPFVFDEEHDTLQFPSNLASSSPSIIPLAPCVRGLTDFRRAVPIPVQAVINALGRLRGLLAECQKFNTASKPEEGQRFLEITAALGVKATERPVQIDSLETLIQMVEARAPDLELHRSNLASGISEFLGLSELYKPGTKVMVLPDGLQGAALGLRVLQSWYETHKTLFGTHLSLRLEMEFMASLGDEFARVTFVDVISEFNGTRKLDALPYPPLPEALEQQLQQRGEVYADVAAGDANGRYLEYAANAFFPKAIGPGAGKQLHALQGAGRVMVDTARGFRAGHSALRGNDAASQALAGALRLSQQLKKQGITDGLRLMDSVPKEDFWACWPSVVGFSFTAKCWGQILVDLTKPVNFQRNAFDQLVLPSDRKELIRAVVRFAGDRAVKTDIVGGKGGSAIFLLHGPPGSGKTLTAEAIAELLGKPLYIVTAGDLGTNAPEVEQSLSSVLQLCAEWQALTLIDEADIFLETRTTSELQRNSVVCVMLRLLEYHQGVLFLTTNRASNVDPAVSSRITVSLEYEALDAAGREAVWTNLLSVVAEKHCILPIDCKTLASHEMNGRQIKNSLLLAKALALERQQLLSLSLLERTVAVVTGRPTKLVPVPPLQLSPRANGLLAPPQVEQSTVSPRVSTVESLPTVVPTPVTVPAREPVVSSLAAYAATPTMLAPPPRIVHVPAVRSPPGSVAGPPPQIVHRVSYSSSYSPLPSFVAPPSPAVTAPALVMPPRISSSQGSLAAGAGPQAGQMSAAARRAFPLASPWPPVVVKAAEEQQLAI